MCLPVLFADYSSTLKMEASCSTETILTKNKFHNFVCKATQNFIFTAVTVTVPCVIVSFVCMVMKFRY